MSEHDEDRELREKIARAYLPSEILSGKPEDLDSLLERIEGEPLSEELVERILQKARGELPLGNEANVEAPAFDEAFTPQEQELLALHRKRGGVPPADVEKKLEKYRAQARRSPGGICGE